jgi:5-methyltetrahydrofolate--homocysteine methyltransferase
MTTLQNILSTRILILDGAMGTMIQRYKLTEADYRGERFKDFSVELKGNNDLLSLTRPDVIDQIHRAYLAAGADIIETNTFNATSISMADYDMQPFVYEMNFVAAQLARKAADDFTSQTPDKPRFVAGSIGPTNKTTSMSPDVENPMYRSVSFNEMKNSYKEQIIALIEGGVDILFIETIFDTLNAKAAVLAAEEVADESGKATPIILSVTLSDKAGRTLSGQTLNAFVTSVMHAKPLAVGLNCSFGASGMKPYVKELGRIAPFYISAYPNAGLPNQLGEYDETPEKMASQIREFIDEGLVNIIGGCCGTSPDHIAQYVKLIEGKTPHQPVEASAFLQLSGMENLTVTPEINFLNIGERCNVAGSRKFLRLINEKKYDEALDIARKQVESGAQVIDVNMDDGLLDGAQEMTNFLNLLASDPDIASVPLMIDSSKWEVLEAGLQCAQGKSIVNSISLKNGETEFLYQAKRIQAYGAAIIVMAFDETGQADTFPRRIEICERAYNLLVNNEFSPKDIIFDPNILAIATGIDEHKNYAVDFIETVRWIKANLPHAKVSGGVSNLSFAFRGNDYIREAMHAVFLYHAIAAGMDMGIINSSQSVLYEDISDDLRELVEDVVLNRTSTSLGNRSPSGVEALLEYASAHNKSAERSQSGAEAQKKTQEWRTFSLEERLSYALVKGIGNYLEEDITEALAKYPRAVDIIDKPLMSGMNHVGDLFGSGKMFLPQVVKAARTMKKAVAILQPSIDAEKAQNRSQSGAEAQKKAGKILLATVKGDVHDIGKNIVSIILSCNNYEIIDLGVMVSPEKIIETIRTENPDIVGLSGLITPSLEEMSIVADEMEKAGFKIPLLIGGATTSKLHTALKIEPKYSQGAVVYVKDASQSPATVANLLNAENKDSYIEKLREEYFMLRENRAEKTKELISLEESRKNSFKINWTEFVPKTPNVPERTLLNNINIKEITPYIDWKFFFHSWKLSAKFHTVSGISTCGHCRAQWLVSFPAGERERAQEAAKLYDDAQEMLQKFVDIDADFIKAVFGLYKAHSKGDTIVIDKKPFPFLRQQTKNDNSASWLASEVVSERSRTVEPLTSREYLCLSDFIAPIESKKPDYIGAFAVTAGAGADYLMQKYEKEGDEYAVLLMKSLLDRLAEAATEWLHAKVRREYWGYAPDENLTVSEMFSVKYQGIRPAVGYPSIPDQSVNFALHELLKSDEIGISLTENGVMSPNASVSGFFFANPQAKYFAVGEISEEQLEDYARRKNVSAEDVRKFLLANL